jgi:hypothetical protein
LSCLGLTRRRSCNLPGSAPREPRPVAMITPEPRVWLQPGKARRPHLRGDAAGLLPSRRFRVVPDATSHTREWRNRQTRRIQVPVPARAWGFNSPLAHPRRSPGPPSVVGRDLSWATSCRWPPLTWVTWATSCRWATTYLGHHLPGPPVVGGPPLTWATSCRWATSFFGHHLPAPHTRSTAPRRAAVTGFGRSYGVLVLVCPPIPLLQSDPHHGKRYPTLFCGGTAAASADVRTQKK